MKKLLFSLFSVLFLIPLSIEAKNEEKGIITGKVLDSQKEPVADALITLKGTVRTVATNSKGEFNLTQVDAGTYTMMISKVEYATQLKEVTVVTGKTETLEISMEEGVLSITSSRPVYLKGVGGNEHLPAVGDFSLNVGKKNEVVVMDRVDANIPMNNTRQIFARVPGVSVWENDGTGIQLGVGSRGLSPNRSIEFNTRMNGYEITPDPMGYPEAYYMPPLEVVERIEIVRGASSLQYGSSYGGLMNFVLKKPDITTPFVFKTQNTTGSNGLFSTFNYIGGTVGKLNYTVFYQKRFGNTTRENSHYNTDNAHVEIGYAVSNKLKIGAELTWMNTKVQQTGGLTDAQFNQNSLISNRTRNWFGTPWIVPALTLEYLINDDARLSFKAFGTKGERNSIGYLGSVDKPDSAQFNRQIDRDYYNNYGAELRYQQKYSLFNKKSTLVAGLRFYDGKTNRVQKGKGDAGTDFNLNLQEKEFQVDIDFGNKNVAAFVENVLNVSDRFAVTAGVRFENATTTAEGKLSRNADGSYVVLSPVERTRNFPLFGVGAEFYATKSSEFYTNFTEAYRALYFSDLSVTDKIDENIKDAKGYNFDIGYRGKIGKWMNFDLNYFMVNYGNRIGSIDIYNADKTATSKFRTNVGSSLSKGVEAYAELDIFVLAGLNKKAGNLSAFANMSFVDATYQDFITTKVSKVDNTFNIEEVNLQGKQVEYAPKTIHRFGLTYSNKNLSATWQLSSYGEVFTDNLNTATANATATTGKLGAYQVQDFSAGYKFLKHYNIKAGVNNITGEKYATRRAGGYPGPGLIPSEGRTFYVSAGMSF
jgi:Fe(3+) dicitrate transport protein